MHNQHDLRFAHATSEFASSRGRARSHGHAVALALAAGLLGVSLAAVAQQGGSAPSAAPVAPSASTTQIPAPSSQGRAPVASSQGMAPAPLPGPRSTGYLAPGSLDMLKVLPPAPVEGDTRYETDRRVFKDTRAWEGTPRWQMASDDALASPADQLRHFSCSVGVELNPASAPKIMNVAQRATRDAGREMLVAKDHFQRKRPFWTDAGNICRPREELGDTFDYPSGHATAGWTWALVLAQVAPDRASQILARGRAIGESRVVCGVHNASAVEGGRYTADAVMALTSVNAEFRADVEGARAELAQLRKSGARPDPARCEREAALVALPITGKERSAR
jgi:acid phosphatase (class A)